MVVLRRRLEHQSPGAAAPRQSGDVRDLRAGYIPQYQVWVGKTPKYVRVEFPLPNDYVDETAIQVLRTAFELYKREDLVSDLVAHFRRQAEAASNPADAAYPRLCASYVLLWNGDKDEAIDEFTRVAETSRTESGLRLELAELLEQQGDRDDALAAADAVQPLDNATMKRREELALRVAVLGGNLERARQAAERLFGLRLDTDTQVRLSGQMHQLGLHELAEAVLGRARRRAGNKAAALVSLMIQYQRQDKLDVAVQVAMQILRSTTGTRQSNPNIYNADDPDAARMAAIGVLSRSGRLTQLIDKANEQLQKTPNAVQIHQTLADYYKAANRRDEMRAELAKVVATPPRRPDPPLPRRQQLVQEGQAEAAIEHYKFILKTDASVVSRYFYQVSRAFTQANKTEDLLVLFETMDLRQVGHPYYVIDALSTFLADDKLRDRAMPLLQGLGYLPRLSQHVVRLYSRRGGVEVSGGLRLRRRGRCPAAGDVCARQSVVGVRRRRHLRHGRADDDRRVQDARPGGVAGRLDELSTRVDAARRRCRTGRPATSCAPWSTAAWAASTGHAR